MECGHIFTSWKERNHHYFKHFESEPFDNSSRDSDSDGSSDDDYNNDSDGNGNDRGNDSYEEEEEEGDGLGESPSNPDTGASPDSFFGESQNHHSYPTNANGYSQWKEMSCVDAMRSLGEDTSRFSQHTSCVGRHSEPNLRPAFRMGSASIPAAHYLIHTDSLRAVEAETGHRYLALKYSAPQSASVRCLAASQRYSRPMLPPLEDLPSPFQKVFSLAKDWGFEYIWIDVFCGIKTDMGGLDAVYQQANLILVIGHPCQRADQIWHFTCDYTHLNMVQSWAKQSVSFHSLQQLGHGAYGVVDKVELRPSRETYARKTIFCTRSQRLSTAQYLQEIEIMRKLQHPHIASFVAAYFDSGAFNILMSPVADCDLRRYLACPEEFPEKRQHLITWFLSLAEALAYIHEQQCRHKDIKPANILISGHTVLLTDFGTSLDFSTMDSKSVGGCLMTPKYCAPEVASHGSRGRSADVFSLGCVFAEMLTVEAGKSLDDMNKCLNIRDDTNRHATYHDHLKELMIWLRGLYRTCLGGVQRKIIHVSMKMLNKSAEQRPSALDVSNELCVNSYCNRLNEGIVCRCCSGKPLSGGRHTEATSDPSEITSLRSMQAHPQRPVYEKQSGDVSKYEAGSSNAVSGVSTADTSPRNIKLLIVDYDLPDYGKLLSMEKMRYWQDLLAVLITQLLKAWTRGLDNVPSVACDTRASSPASRTIRSPLRAANVRKGPTRACRAASVGSSRLVPKHVS